MRDEFQQALRGVKQPLGMHHRVLMVMVAFAFCYLGLWLLHLLYATKNYVFLVFALVLFQVVGVGAGRLIWMAVLSPPKARV